MKYLRSSLEKERVLILGSMLLIAILAAIVPFALRIPTLAESFTASAGCVPCSCPGKVTGGGQIPKVCAPEGKASFGFIIVYYAGDPAPKGELQYIDHESGMKVHGHDMIYLKVSADKKKAEFSGIDKYSGHTFKVYVEDNGEPGKKDVFKIAIDGYSAGGTLLHGNIQIHKKP